MQVDIFLVDLAPRHAGFGTAMFDTPRARLFLRAFDLGASAAGAGVRNVVALPLAASKRAVNTRNKWAVVILVQGNLQGPHCWRILECLWRRSNR